MILAWLAAAEAGTLLTLDTHPDIAPIEGEALVPPDAVVPDMRYTAVDAHATRQLGEELLAVRPLMHKFDGELEIMSRLDAVTSQVRIIRDKQERRMMYQALAFEGFAVQRYFQEGLGTEPAGEPYRVVIGDRVEVKAWVDAVALDPFHEPTRADVSEEPELTEFKATRDRLLYAAPAMVFVDAVPPGAEVVLDGQVQATDPAAGFRLYAGRHRLMVTVGSTIVERDDFVVGPGEIRHVTVPPSQKELDDLTLALRDAPDRVTLTDALNRAIGSLPDPVRVCANGPDGLPLYYRLDGDELFRIDPEVARADRLEATVRTRLGVGLVHDPAFVHGGAPDAFATRNGGGLLIGLDATWRFDRPAADPFADEPTLPPWVVVIGADVYAPGGEWHAVPVGDREVRLRAAPWVGAGLPAAQVTLGAVFPWYTTIGVRGTLPLAGPTHLELAVAQGLFAFRSDRPVARGAPATALVGVSTRFGD